MKLFSISGFVSAFKGSVLFSALAFSLFSCNNFLEGGNFKDQLDADIAYAESAAYEIRVECEEGTGSISTGTILQKKVTDVFTVEFKMSSGYQFLKWMAYSKSEDGTLSELSSDYISCSSGTSSSDGIFKTSVSFLKTASNIVIKPVCIELPRVLSHFPSSTESQYANAPVIVNFNMPMESKSILPSESLFTYEHISVTYIDASNIQNDMSSYFEAPLFDSEKKKLTLAPKSLLLKSFMENLHVGFIELRISFNSTISVEREGQTFSLVHDDNATFAVRYKPEIETVAPVKSAFFATRKQISLSDNQLSEEELFVFKNLDEMEDEDILQNRVTDSFYIYGKYYDADSGVDKVVVTQDGYEPHEFFDGSENAEFFTDENGYTFFCVKFELDAFDDAYLIDVSVADACDNRAESESFYVISRKTYAAADLNLYISNGYENLTSYFQSMSSSDIYFENIEQFNTFVDEYSTFTKTIKIYDSANAEVSYGDDYCSEVRVYGDCWQNWLGYSFYCEYTDKSGTSRRETFDLSSDEESGKRCWSLALDVDKICDTSVRIIVEDEMGATGEYEHRFLPKMYLIEESDRFNPSESISNGILFSKDETGRINSSTLFQGSSFSKTEDGSEIGLVYWGRSGSLSDFVPVKKTSGSVEITDISIVTEDGKNYVAFAFANDTWEKFDFIDLNVKGIERGTGWSGEKFVYSDRIQKGTLTYIFKPDSYYYTAFNYGTEATVFLFNEGATFYFDGNSNTDALINLQTTSCKILDYDDSNGTFWVTEAMFDVLPPEVALEQNTNGTFQFVVRENPQASGPKNGTFTIGSKTYSISASAESSYEYYYEGSIPKSSVKKTAEIPLSEFYLLSSAGDSQDKRRLTYHYAAYDNNGNKSEGNAEYTFSIGFSRVTFEVDFSEAAANTIRVYQGAWPDVDTDFYILDTSSSSYCWKLIQTEKNSERSNRYNDYFSVPSGCELWEDNAWKDKFIRFTGTNSNKKIKRPSYIYTGVAGTGNYDFLIRNGNLKDVVLVSSDAPVFVHAYRTSAAYEECKDWTAEQWMLIGEEVNFSGQQLDFSTDNHDFKKYIIYTNYITEGECYVVIAHYANQDSFGNSDSVITSEVFQR